MVKQLIRSLRRAEALHEVDSVAEEERDLEAIEILRLSDSRPSVTPIF